MLSFFEPWEPSLVLPLVFAVCGVLYLRGSWRARTGVSRQLAFWFGFVLFYVALQTRVDYYAEHQFFIHRLQHLVLHHLAPLCVMAAYPGSTLRAGLPLRWRIRLHRARRSGVARALSAVLLSPALISLAFVFSVLFWLVPPVQFVAMLDARIYTLMNWSVAVTGLAYWWMVLDHRPAPPARARPGLRVLSPVITMTPQILAGAIITFSSADLYPVFTLCGRAFTSIPVGLDQSLGGLIMWVPAAVLESLGAIIALRRMMELSESARSRAQQAQRVRPARAAVPRASSAG
jgi:putative membrane protein